MARVCVKAYLVDDDGKLNEVMSTGTYDNMPDEAPAKAVEAAETYLTSQKPPDQRAGGDTVAPPGEGGAAGEGEVGGGT